jgi:hypothetical protein
MAYLSLRTATGHVLMVEPTRQRTMFRDLQDAMLAEARLEQRQLAYWTYRSNRGLPGEEGGGITIRSSVKGQLNQLDDATFRNLDVGILAIAKKPKRAASQPKYYRWFLADFRRMIVGNIPVLYVIGEQNCLEIVFLGMPRWSSAKPVSSQIENQNKRAYSFNGRPKHST